MKYTILRIEEDLDFGCEERTKDTPVMAVLTLTDNEGNERIIRYPDKELYELGINEGDQVQPGLDGRIVKTG